MHRILIILLLALPALPLAMRAEPKTRPDRPATEDSTPEERRRSQIASLESVCDDTALRAEQIPWKALMGRTIAPGYYVGISAQKAWRPMEIFGDRDAKVRVFNPTVGVAVRYSF
ncbi:MAG: hypothetical protein K2F77_02125 [Muribaculaceae bacterium]|nr:hypothetical protein [Muribaculaceae bacterium]